MTDDFKYTAQDIARHVLREEGDPPLKIGDGEILEGATVAEVIADSCMVGYGGHYYEVMEDDREGEDMRALADHLKPLYGLTWQETYDLIDKVRQQWIRYILDGEKRARKRWAQTDWFVELRPANLDECPTCGKRIIDTDEAGCEAPDGQRWCIGHALEALATHRPKPDSPQPGEAYS